MKTTRLITVLLGLAPIAMVTADVAAYYHPRMGRFLSRDLGPGGANRIGSGADVRMQAHHATPRDIADDRIQKLSCLLQQLQSHLLDQPTALCLPGRGTATNHPLQSSQELLLSRLLVSSSSFPDLLC